MKEIRPSKPDDQQQVNYALSLIKDLYDKYPEIEANIWCSAILSALAVGYLASGFSFKEFEKELKDYLLFAKHWFEE